MEINQPIERSKAGNRNFRLSQPSAGWESSFKTMNIIRGDSITGDLPESLPPKNKKKRKEEIKPTSREVYLMEEVNTGNVKKIQEEIKKLWGKDGSKDIFLFVCSPGGSPSIGIAFYDWVKSKKISLVTIGMGRVDSAAIPIFLSGVKRKATPHTGFLIHPIFRVWEKPFSLSEKDMREAAQDLELSSHHLEDILKRETKIPDSELNQKGEKTLLLNANQAKEWGLIDEIIEV